jgi:hypothetical protein
LIVYQSVPSSSLCVLVLARTGSNGKPDSRRTMCGDREQASGL